MNEISQSTDFTANIRGNAENYMNMLLDGKLFTTVLFTLDVVSILKDVSLTFQYSNGFISGMENKHIDMIMKLSKMYENYGPNIALLLNSAQCLKANIWQTCNIHDIESCDYKFSLQGHTAIFINTASRFRGGKWLPLSEFRTKILNALMMEINNNFPEGSLELFEVFNMINLLTDVAGISEYTLQIKTTN